MDPYQYYGFTQAVLNGQMKWNEFEVASVFPFLLLPFVACGQSIVAALWVNVLSAAVLLVAIHFLCRELRLRIPSAVVALPVLTSPLLLGLSRELYIEYTLTALVAVAFIFWLHMLKTGSVTSRVFLAVSLGAGTMVKMTFPLFFVAPFGAAALLDVRKKDYVRLRSLVAVTLVPAFAVLGIQYFVFRASFEYYTTLGNTTNPIIPLIGPGDQWSWHSVSYYYLVLAQLGLSFLLLFMPAAVVRTVKTARQLGWNAVTAEAAQLWLWLVGPLTLLILQPVKEPRHIAPCVVPAVLLVFWGLDTVRPRALRATLAALALAVAIGHFLSVTQRMIYTPYYLTGSMGLAEIEDLMRHSAWQHPEYQDRPDFSELSSRFQRAIWAYNQNIAIVGFDPNTALALTWHFYPAVVFDLDVIEQQSAKSADGGLARFEDPYILAAFGTYNRRSGIARAYDVLKRDEIIAASEFLLINEQDYPHASELYKQHQWLASVETSGGRVAVLKAVAPRAESFRTIFAREFLQTHVELREAEEHAITRERLCAAILRGQFQAVDAILASDPGFGDPYSPPRNIYWIHGYQQLEELAMFLYGDYQRKRKG
jgi:hypothetical protein